MKETALVTILMQGGMSHARAVAFERHVDDDGVVSGGADALASVLMRWRCLETARLMQQLDDSHAMCELLSGRTLPRPSVEEVASY